MISKFPKHIVTPAVLAETENFLVKLAENHEEIENAQRLRYKVFNLEQNRGLKNTEKFGIDFDEYDEYCMHLIVIEKSSGDVIGTYRVHLGCIANSAKGFYSSKEYEIHGLYNLADKCIELGRTCIDPKFRSGAIIAFLWGAITELLVRADLIYMLGCVSLENTESAAGWALYEYLCRKNLLCKDIKATPRPGFKMDRPPKNIIDNILSDEASLKNIIPPLFKGYLHLGALICGEPAIDRDFGAIDFFIILNIETVPERYKRHFNYRKNTEKKP
ncbi:MAG: GNAT family N-acyltransferase [Candidatus Omnitrophota bacterium]|jgi:putative hemolysin